MTRFFILIFSVALVSAQSTAPAQAGVLSKFFNDLFSGWGSKAASEPAGRAGARGAARTSQRARSDKDGFATRAGKSTLEQAAQQGLSNAANDRTERRRGLNARRMQPRGLRQRN